MNDMKKVLIVDDEVTITDLLTDYCEELGFEVRCVNDSRQARLAAMAWHPDLICLDLAMPQVDGWSVLRELRSCRSCQSIPVMIVSVMVGDGVRAPERVEATLAKPVSFVQFTDKVRGVLHMAEAA
jgi:DNA-binding response OmpR family regulator